MRLEWALAGVLVLAVMLAWVRLWRWQGVAGKGWRFWGLMALQPVAAGLLWLVLVPPALVVPGGTLVVATRGAGVAEGAVRLPEAGRADVPDLAAAVRRAGAVRVKVLGEGLEVRDRAVARGLGVAFAGVELPRGVVRMEVGEGVVPGGRVRVSGVVKGVSGGVVELMEPSGGRGERGVIAADGGFVVGGLVRAGGGADWRLRVLDADGGVVETLVVPVVAAVPVPARVLVRAGAPGPELKYLQRWAADAGLDVVASAAVGGGVMLGESVGFSGGNLARFDVVVLDERSWGALGAGERGALMAAVRGGLGLVLRVSGPVSAGVRRDWAGLGLGLGGGDARAVRLTDGGVVQALPLVAGRFAVPFVRDVRGLPVAAWVALGRGRVALWPVTDGYAMVLQGEKGRAAGLWSGVFGVVSRGFGRVLDVPAVGFVGEMMRVCGGDAVAAPGGDVVRLVADVGARPELGGCAGYWPGVAGWHAVRAGNVERPVRVLGAGDWPGVRAAERRDATRALVGEAGVRGVGREVPGAVWPWFLGFLGVAGGMWWLERRRGGVGRPV